MDTSSYGAPGLSEFISPPCPGSCKQLPAQADMAQGCRLLSMEQAVVKCIPIGLDVATARETLDPLIIPSISRVAAGPLCQLSPKPRLERPSIQGQLHAARSGWLGCECLLLHLHTGRCHGYTRSRQAWTQMKGMFYDWNRNGVRR